VEPARSSGKRLARKFRNRASSGAEGHGTIQFIGTFSTFTWVVPTPENWHGFTFGIRTTLAIEPNPVPEPSALALVALGLLALPWVNRRGRRLRMLGARRA